VRNTITYWDMKFRRALILAKEKVRLRKSPNLSIGEAALLSLQRKPMAARTATSNIALAAKLKPDLCT
jgi:hypothetical protein